MFVLSNVDVTFSSFIVIFGTENVAFNTSPLPLSLKFSILNEKIKVDQLKDLYIEKNESVPTTSQTIKKILKRPNIDIFDIEEYRI